MTLAEMAMAYNAEIRRSLETLYTALPPGQQRTVLKKEKVRALLEKFKVIESEAAEK